MYFQKEEVSAELLTFHEVVNHMQEDEEEVIDDHREITEVNAENFCMELNCNKIK